MDVYIMHYSARAEISNPKNDFTGNLREDSVLGRVGAASVHIFEGINVINFLYFGGNIFVYENINKTVFSINILVENYSNRTENRVCK